MSARDCRHYRGSCPHGRIWLLLVDSLEVYLVDRQWQSVWIGLRLYVRIAKPLFLLRRPYIISEVRKERGDTMDVGDAAGSSPRLPVRPGQFGWLTLWGSPFKLTAHPF